MAKGSVIARILSQYSDKGTKAAVKDFTKMSKKFGDFADKTAKAFGVATIAVAAFATKVSKDAVGAAIQAQTEQNRLAQLLRVTNGATDEQIGLLFKQADALERVGVVSAGNVNVVQAQLATFDLQLATISKLTPAILDYVTAEKGAAASADEFKSLTNGLAQALQGNFASLTKTGFVLDQATKDQIKFGTEAQRSAALVRVLESTYKGFNQQLRNTPEGRLIVLGNEFRRIQTIFGSALLPVVETFARVMEQRVLPAFDKFVNENSTKIAAVFQVGIEYALAFASRLYDLFSFVARNIKVFQILGSVIVATFVAAKAAAAATAIISTITTIITLMKALRTASLAAAAAEALATGGLSAAAGAAAFAGALVAIGVASRNFNKDLDKTTAGLGKFKVDTDKGITATAKNYTAKVDKMTNSTKALTDAQKNDIEAQKLKDKIYKKFGIKVQSNDLNTLGAVLANLERTNFGLSSPTISLAASAGANGSINSNTTNNGGSITVNVAGSVVTENDLVQAIANGLTSLDRRGGGGAVGRYGVAVAV